MRIVVSSVGTSLLANLCRDEAERRRLAEFVHLPEKECQPPQLTFLEGLLERSFPLEKPGQACAELNALLALGGFKSKPQHWLLHSDTACGKAVANRLRRWFEDHQESCGLLCMEELHPDDPAGFHRALSDLVNWCEETLQPSRDQGWKITFNLNGGFKSTCGFLQTLGTFYADEIIYLFENSTQLLTIPRLPVKLATEEEVERHLEFFRTVSSLGEVAGDEVPNAFPELFLMRIDDRAGLSAWGTLVWKRNRSALYRQKFWEPALPGVRLARSFWRSIEGLPSDRLEQLNARFDDLRRFRATGVNPKTLNYKPIHSKSHGTHEFRAWSDNDARRVYCRQDGNELEIVEVAAHL